MKKESKDKMLNGQFLHTYLCKGANQSILLPVHSIHRPLLHTDSHFPVWLAHKASARRKKMEERFDSSCQHSSASANGSTTLASFCSKQNMTVRGSKLG